MTGPIRHGKRSNQGACEVESGRVCVSRRRECRDLGNLVRSEEKISERVEMTNTVLENEGWMMIGWSDFEQMQRRSM